MSHLTQANVFGVKGTYPDTARACTALKPASSDMYGPEPGAYACDTLSMQQCHPTCLLLQQMPRPAVYRMNNKPASVISAYSGIAGDCICCSVPMSQGHRPDMDPPSSSGPMRCKVNCLMVVYVIR